MPEQLKVKGSNAKAALVEHLVDKRCRCLEYFRQLHTREDVLWMNTVRLGKSDICEYFHVDSSILDVRRRNTTNPKLSSNQPRVTIRHTRTESSQQPHDAASTSAGGPRSHSRSNSSSMLQSAANTHEVITSTSLPLQHIDGFSKQVSKSWVEEYLPKYFVLGVTLSELLLVPVSGSDFVDAVFQLFLELDVVFASGSTAKAIAGRTLKNHRWARAQRLGQSNADAATPKDADAVEGPIGVGSSPRVVITAKPLYINEQAVQYQAPLPSYDILIPSLCTTVIFAYRRMCDFDAIEDEEAVRQILSIDKKFKRLFFGNLSKEIQKLARLRMLQQALVVTDHVLGAYSQADDNLVAELLRSSASRQRERDDDERKDANNDNSNRTLSEEPQVTSNELLRDSGRQKHFDASVRDLTDDDDL